jgi:hypothetical protein
VNSLFSELFTHRTTGRLRAVGLRGTELATMVGHSEASKGTRRTPQEARAEQNACLIRENQPNLPLAPSNLA